MDLLNFTIMTKEAVSVIFDIPLFRRSAFPFTIQPRMASVKNKFASNGFFRGEWKPSGFTCVSIAGKHSTKSTSISGIILLF